MADHKVQENADDAKLQAGRLEGRLVPMLIIGALMLGEGIGVYLIAKAIGGKPVAAMAGVRNASDGDCGVGSVEDVVEIDLAESRPSNRMSGKFVTFHIRVSALVSSEQREEVEAIVRAKQARIDDAVNVVIRGADPSHLNEPGLETIRRRLRHEFGRIFGDDEIIRQVLIPQMLQSGRGL